jgi:hypothetical protein
MLASEYKERKQQKQAEETKPTKDGDVSGQGHSLWLSPELAMRAAEARKKRVHVRYAASLDRA